MSFLFFRFLRAKHSEGERLEAGGLALEKTRNIRFQTIVASFCGRSDRDLFTEDITLRSALRNLKKSNDILILPADKGRTTVVLDKSDYDEKMMAMLNDDGLTYQEFSSRPGTIYGKKIKCSTSPTQEESVNTQWLI